MQASEAIQDWLSCCERKNAEHRIGEMAFHQLGGPQFPIFQQVMESVAATVVGVAAQKFSGSGRSAGARIEQGDVDLAFGERAVDERQVADDRGEESETEARFGDDQGASQAGARDNIAQAQREKGRAAEIKIRAEAGLRPAVAEPPLEHLPRSRRRTA